VRTGSSILLLALVLATFALGQDALRPLPGEDCIERIQAVTTQVREGRLHEAELALSGMVAGGGASLEPSCASLVFNQLASIMAISGRVAEAETFAERAVKTLSAIYPPNDPGLLRPLQILAAVQLEQGKTGRARIAFQRMRSIQAQGPEDRALVHGIAAALLEKEGNLKQAESEYLESFDAWNESGHGNWADAASIQGFLALLYIRDHRLDDAQRAVDLALMILGRAKDAVSLDWIKLWTIRALLYSHRGDWRNAEVDLQHATSAAEHEVGLAPALLSSMWANYAQALRKNHKKREAHSAAARATTLGAGETQHTVVDVTDLRDGVRVR
jgi:tetratricopeptide (TPR) repeat protein